MKKLFLLFGCAGLAWAAAAQVAPKMTAVRQVDADANGKTNPGDTLRYTINFTNTSATNLLNVVFTDTNFPNQTFVVGSIKSTPIARPDSTNAIGNTLLTVAAPGVLTNDSDPDGDPVSVSGFSPTSANGGSVSVAANGSFTYISAAGFTGTDTFTYTISDGNGGTSTATVTVTVAVRVWYVNNAGANGDGRQTSPFNSLTGAATASGVNDFIYLFQGSGNYTAGITLKNGQQLVGSGDALVVGGTTISSAGARPTILAGSGSGVSLGSDNIVHGLNVGTSSGRAFSGASVGNLAISNVIATATGDRVVSLANGTVNVTLDNATSTGSADNGINLSSLNGSFVVNGGSISTAASTDFFVAGGNGTITYAGSINNATGRSVDISGRTGGTVTLSGNIADTGTGIIVQNNFGGTTTFSGASKSLNTGANPAVTLTSNTGHTINFSNGGLAITTSSGTGLTATGGATISVQGPGNTINSGTATALNVVNTTIGASGLTFQSISSSGGSAAGIILDGTGASGGLTVTGTGGAASGGTIASKSGASANTVNLDGTLTITGTAGIGIFLRNTAAISLTRMQINDHGNFGILGQNVTGFTYANGVVSGANGDAPLLNEGSVRFDNLLGTCSISASTISGAMKDNLQIRNASGTLTSLAITGSTFQDNNSANGTDGLAIYGQGTANMTVSVTGSTFRRNGQDNFKAYSLGNAALNVTFQSNTLTAGHPSGLGGTFLMALDNSAGLTFNVTGNSINGALLSAMTLFVSNLTTAGAHANGTFANNIIGTTGVANSGSAQGSGLAVTATGLATVTVAITGNQIRQFNGMGIDLSGGDTSPAVNATITGNVVKEPVSPNALHGIYVNMGITSVGAVTACIDIGGAGALRNDVLGGGLAAGGGSDIRVRQRFSSTVRLPGYGGAATDTAAVIAFLQGRNNIGGSPVVTATAASPPGGGFIGGAACIQP